MKIPLFLATKVVDVEVKRFEQGEYVKGVWKDGTSSSITIKANVQPVIRSYDTILLPDGDKSKEAIKIFTTFELRQVQAGESPIAADVILWEGREWEVKKSVTWRMGILNHTEALAVRKETF